MRVERIGYRRLYDAVACSIAGREELRFEFQLGTELHAVVYLGPRPRFGIWVTTHGDKYVTPGALSLLMKAQYHKDPADSDYPRRFFTEIFCGKDVQIADDISAAFHAKDRVGHEALLRLAQENSEEFISGADAIAGIIGIRFHPQFVKELLNENFVALRDDDHAHNVAGNWIQLVGDITLNEAGIEGASRLFPAIGEANEQATQFASVALAWLLRAWTERDTVSKFMSLFIPLEFIMSAHKAPARADSRKQARTIRRLIREHGGERANELLQFFNGLVGRQRPSLAYRFRAMAGDLALAGWEDDVAAFEEFNEMRNAILHRGQRKVQLQVSIGNKQVQRLEHLTERYVNYVLFRDDRVYSASVRPRDPPMH